MAEIAGGTQIVLTISLSSLSLSIISTDDDCSRSEIPSLANPLVCFRINRRKFALAPA